MRLIDADALYERLKADEELARDRVIDTPNSFPNGMLNPAAVRYQAQLTERTRLKEIVYDAPTIEPEDKCGECDAWNQYKNYPRQRWIPCSERLPFAEYGESDNVLATCELRNADDTSYRWVKILYFNGGVWCYPTGETYEQKVVAWMPLPESYLGETESRDYKNKGDDD